MERTHLRPTAPAAGPNVLFGALHALGREALGVFLAGLKLSQVGQR